MPLQNRVDPFGDLHAIAQRGFLMGNRAGRFHDDAQKIGARRHVSRRWICCVCNFRGRKRTVWGASYTELFFLDEVTALAAGHRPCFECRRADAEQFAKAFGASSADAMDQVLDAERREGRTKKRHTMPMRALCNGVMIARGDEAFAMCDDALLKWSFSGYVAKQQIAWNENVEVLTPPSIIAALARGYMPLWHKSVL